MKTKRTRLVTLLACLLCAFSVSMVTYAYEAPDTEQICSIALTMRDGSVAVSGGSLTIYRVGEVNENNGDYSFKPTGAFAACGESFDNLEEAADMAGRLLSFVQLNSLEGTSTKTIDADGNVTFDNLQCGLYLIAQHEAAARYKKLLPFLVSLPSYENGAYNYDIAGNPKAELEKSSMPPEGPPENPSQPPTHHDASDLPQTGQLWWPVPVLASAGLLLLAVGVAQNRRKTADKNE